MKLARPPKAFPYSAHGSESHTALHAPSKKMGCSFVFNRREAAGCAVVVRNEVEHRQHAAARAAADHGNAADSPKLFIVYEMKKMSLPSNK